MIKKTLSTFGIILGISTMVVHFNLCFTKPVLAQTSTILSTSTPTSALVTPTLTNNQNNELESINKRLDTISTYNDTLVSVVEWSLGINIAILVALLAVNWMSSNIKYKYELNEFMKNMSDDVAKETKISINEISTSINKKIEEIEKQNIKKIDDGFSIINENNTSVIHVMNKKLDDYLASTKTQINELYLSKLHMDAREHEENRRFQSAISCYADMLHLHPEESEIEDTLQSLINALMKYEGKIPPFLISKVEKEIRFVESEQRTLSEKIYNLLKEKI